MVYIIVSVRSKILLKLQAYHEIIIILFNSMIELNNIILRQPFAYCREKKKNYSLLYTDIIVIFIFW